MQMIQRLSLVIALALSIGPGAERVSGFTLIGPTWIPGPIVMQLQLGSSGGTLINGCPDWGCAANRALGDWNRFLNRTEFLAVPNSNASTGLSSGTTNVIFS